MIIIGFAIWLFIALLYFGVLGLLFWWLARARKAGSIRSDSASAIFCFLVGVAVAPFLTLLLSLPINVPDDVPYERYDEYRLIANPLTAYAVSWIIGAGIACFGVWAQARDRARQA
jgi:hypothetical protein